MSRGVCVAVDDCSAAARFKLFADGVYGSGDNDLVKVFAVGEDIFRRGDCAVFKRYFSKTGAVVECAGGVMRGRYNCLRDSELCKLLAVVENAASHLCKPARESKVCKLCTLIKSAVFYFRDRIRESNALKSFAVLESVFSDLCNGIGDIYLGEVFAVLKNIRRNRCCAVFKCCLLKTCAVVERAGEVRA